MTEPKYYAVEINATCLHSKEDEGKEMQYALQLFVGPIPHGMAEKLYPSLRDKAIEFLVQEGVVDPNYLTVKWEKEDGSGGSFH